MKTAQSTAIMTVCLLMLVDKTDLGVVLKL